MAILTGWCINGHKIEVSVMSCDVRRIDDDGVVAVTGIEDVTCDECGKLMTDLEVEE